MDESEIILAKQIMKKLSTSYWIVNDFDMMLRASSCGHLVVIKYLVSLGIDPTAMNNYVVKLASVNGHLDIMKYLISIGVDITENDNYIIKLAAINGHLEIVKYLVSIGINITAGINEALKIAYERGYPEISKFLISIGGCHESIDLHDYVSILNWKHLSYPIDDRFRKIIIARENQKRVMTDYCDIIIITVTQ